MPSTCCHQSAVSWAIKSTSKRPRLADADRIVSDQRRMRRLTAERFGFRSNVTTWVLYRVRRRRDRQGGQDWRHVSTEKSEMIMISRSPFRETVDIGCGDLWLERRITSVVLVTRAAFLFYSATTVWILDTTSLWTVCLFLWSWWPAVLPLNCCLILNCVTLRSSFFDVSRVYFGERWDRVVSIPLFRAPSFFNSSTEICLSASRVQSFPLAWNPSSDPICVRYLSEAMSLGSKISSFFQSDKEDEKAMLDPSADTGGEAAHGTENTGGRCLA